MSFVWIRYLVLAALIATVNVASAEQVEYVIAFNRVVVRGLMEIYDSPKLAHSDPVEGVVAQPSIDDRPSGESSRAGNGTEPPPTTVVRGRPAQPMAFAPGQGIVNPSFTEQGFLVESFWAIHTGTP